VILAVNAADTDVGRVVVCGSEPGSTRRGGRAGDAATLVGVAETVTGVTLVGTGVAVLCEVLGAGATCPERSRTAMTLITTTTAAAMIAAALHQPTHGRRRDGPVTAAAGLAARRPPRG
jgi:hypothetical protein